MGGLAGPEGKAATQSGATLKRDATYMDASDNGRTISSRLLQPANMDRASIGTYDNKADGTPVPGLDVAIPGMGTVTYRNPWGQEETVSQKEFDKHVDAVVRPVPKGAAVLA